MLDAVVSRMQLSGISQVIFLPRFAHLCAEDIETLASNNTVLGIIFQNEENSRVGCPRL